MLPIQFIILLILASLPYELAQAGPGGSGMQALWTQDAVLLTGLLYASQLLVAAVVWWRTRSAIRLLHEPSSSATAVTLKTDNLFASARILTLVLTATFLFCTSLSGSMVAWLDQTVLLRHFPIVLELYFIFPALLAWLVIWTAGYFVESAVRERGMPYQLAREMPIHEMPPLGQYLSMQLRHNCYPLIFLFLRALFVLMGEGIGHWFPKAEDPIMAVVGLGVTFVALPILLVHIWKTTPLTGALRGRLDRVAALYRLRFRNILLWNTHNLFANAAILGWVPFGRYFLMTDSLLERVTDRELEAVFAHEVGHGVHRHPYWYVATLMGALGLSIGASSLALQTIPHAWIHYAGGEEAMLTLLSVPFMFLFVALTLPFVAARFEHQADWFACRHMARRIEEGPDDEIASPAVKPILTPVDARQVLTGRSGGGGGGEGITLSQYLVGNYPHASSAPAKTTPTPSPEIALTAAPAAPPGPALAPAVRSALAAQAGAEVFIAALDTIVESSHKSRERRGLMHPSINGRIALLREMAVNPVRAKQFNRSMFWTRVAIVLVLLAGFAVAAFTPEPTRVNAPIMPATTSTASRPT